MTAKNFTLPPDNRSTGSGSPAQDVNGLADYALQGGYAYSILNTAFAGGAHTDGTSDSTAAIQACWNAAAAAGLPAFIPGGVLFRVSQLTWVSGLIVQGVYGGTFPGNDTITTASVLARLAGTNLDLIVAPDGVNYGAIRDISIDGNKNNNSSGIAFKVQDGAADQEGQITIERCNFHDNPGTIVYFGNNRRGNRVLRSSLLWSATGDGVTLAGSDNTVQNCFIGDNARAGVCVGTSITQNWAATTSFVPSLNHVQNNDIFKNLVGVAIASGVTDVMVSGNGIDRNSRQGITVYDGTANALVGNSLHSNSYTSSGTYAHIDLGVITSITVDDNNFGPLDGDAPGAPLACVNLASGTASGPIMGNLGTMHATSAVGFINSSANTPAYTTLSRSGATVFGSGNDVLNLKTAGGTTITKVTNGGSFVHSGGGAQYTQAQNVFGSSTALASSVVSLVGTATGVAQLKTQLFPAQTADIADFFASDGVTALAKILASGQYVGPHNVLTFGADPTGTADSTSAFQAAINSVTSPGGSVDIPPGTYKITSQLTMANKQVYLRGAGRWATQLNFTGTGDCVRIYSTTTLAAPVSGGVLDLTIDGTSAGAGSSGLHIGDTRAAELRIAVQNFSGAGSMGAHFDNQYAWTEETHGYLWLSNCTQHLVFDVSAPPATTVAAGSNGGTISGIATWGGTFGGNGVLVVASTALYPTSGTLTVAASGSTTAVVTYTGITGTTFTGCAYVSGSPSGTVATGGAVGLVSSDNSFGYSDLTVEILAKVGQDGLVCQNGAVLYHSRVNVKGNFQGSTTANTSAAIRITGVMPANHPHSNGSAIQNSDFSFMAECSASPGSNAPQTIAFGTLTGGTLNNLTGCVGVLDFTFGALAFAQTNYTSGGAAGAFSFMGLVMGDFNLNPATSGVGSGVSFFIGAPISFSRSLFNTTNGNLLIDRGDFFQIILAQSVTLSLIGGGSAFGTAQRKTVFIKQPASGGPFTVTFPHNGSPTTANPTINWAGGTAPTLSTAANALDVIELSTYDGSVWLGTAHLNVS